jgi:hypothetical protein
MAVPHKFSRQGTLKQTFLMPLTDIYLERIVSEMTASTQNEMIKFSWILPTEVRNVTGNQIVERNVFDEVWIERFGHFNHSSCIDNFRSRWRREVDLAPKMDS